MKIPLGILIYILASHAYAGDRGHFNQDNPFKGSSRSLERIQAEISREKNGNETSIEPGHYINNQKVSGSRPSPQKSRPGSTKMDQTQGAKDPGPVTKDKKEGQQILKLDFSKLKDLLKNGITLRANMMGISKGNNKEFDLIRLPQALQLAEKYDSGTFKPTPTAIIALSPEGTSISNLNKNMTLTSHGSSMVDIVKQVAGKRADVWSLSAGIKTNEGKLKMTQMAEVIGFATDQGAKVIVLSLSSDGRTETIRAIDKALDRGITVVMAVGNEGLQDTAMLPSQDKRIIMVGSVLNSGKRAPESNYGVTIEGIKVVDIYAPGRLFVSLPGGKKDLAIGTSFASPVVGGVAAVLVSIQPKIKRQMLTQVLEDSAKTKTGLPVLNASKSIEQLLKHKELNLNLR